MNRSINNREMRLVVLHEGMAGNTPLRLENLREAARGSVEFHSIDSLECNYAQLPSLGAGDMLYNAGRGSARLETLLINSQVATFYGRNPLYIADRHDSTLFTVVHERFALPAPKTIHQVSTSRAALECAVETLGGFPIILKSIGGSMGVGTVLVESWRSLRSVVDLLQHSGMQFILREYIEPGEVCRLTVLGGQVVASNVKYIATNDFRTSVRERPVEPRTYDPSVQALAVSAAQVLDLEFGGADIILDKKGNPYLLEFNFPCDYVTSEKACAVPIGRMMVTHLKDKAHRMLAMTPP